MIANFGFGALLITFVVALYGIFAAVYGVRKNSLAWVESARASMLLTFPLLTLVALAIIALLVAGAVAGFAGRVVPGVEPMIAASLLELGLLVATRRGLPLAVAAALAGGFAFFHGAAHGQELGGDAQWLALAGMVASTATLHLAGVGLGHWLQARHRLAGTAAGGAVALLGATLLLRMA